MIHLYHHLGLGDHIICNALVRSVADKHGDIGLYTKVHNANSVSKMFNDDKRINIIPVVADQFVPVASNVIRVGFEFFDHALHFDESFYKQLGIPFETRWTGFKYVRDYQSEHKMVTALQPTGKYVFLHEDVARGFVINRKYLPKDCQIFEPKDKSVDIFSYLSLIEHAEEFHGIHSSFAHLVDSYPITKRCVLHRYARKAAECECAVFRDGWEVIKDAK